MAGLNTRRQFGAEFAVIEALIHMGQHRAARPHTLDPGQHLGQIGVRRVRLPAQAIDDPQLDPGQRRESIIVELDDIG